MSVPADLLAHWWSQPDPDQRRWWADAWDAAAESDRLLATNLVSDLHAAFDSSREDELLEEYERLLVGPGRIPCPPYESLWREGQPRLEQGRVMAAAAAETATLYRQLGLQLRPAAHELPDHVAIEWEALAYALQQKAHEPARHLLHEHLARWMPGFCASVADETTEPFYRVLAQLTPAWTAALAA